MRKDYETGRWIEIGEAKAREKVGHAIRIALKKRSSARKTSHSSSDQKRCSKSGGNVPPTMAGVQTPPNQPSLNKVSASRESVRNVHSVDTAPRSTEWYYQPSGAHNKVDTTISSPKNASKTVGATHVNPQPNTARFPSQSSDEIPLPVSAGPKPGSPVHLREGGQEQAVQTRFFSDPELSPASSACSIQLFDDFPYPDKNQMEYLSYLQENQGVLPKRGQAQIGGMKATASPSSSANFVGAAAANSHNFATAHAGTDGADNALQPTELSKDDLSVLMPRLLPLPGNKTVLESVLQKRSNSNRGKQGDDSAVRNDEGVASARSSSNQIQLSLASCSIDTDESSRGKKAGTSHQSNTKNH